MAGDRWVRTSFILLTFHRLSSSLGGVYVGGKPNLCTDFGLARIIHIFEDNKSLLCYKHVVETMFAATKEASECLTIAQQSVCCSQEFFASL